jgi:hypothetical protein
LAFTAQAAKFATNIAVFVANGVAADYAESNRRQSEILLAWTPLTEK